MTGVGETKGSLHKARGEEYYMHPHTKLPSETPLFRLSFQDMQSIHYENYTQLKEGSASTNFSFQAKWLAEIAGQCSNGWCTK